MKQLTDVFKLANNYAIPCVGFGNWQTPDGQTAVTSDSDMETISNMEYCGGSGLHPDKIDF